MLHLVWFSSRKISQWQLDPHSWPTVYYYKKYGQVIKYVNFFL